MGGELLLTETLLHNKTDAKHQFLSAPLYSVEINPELLPIQQTHSDWRLRGGLGCVGNSSSQCAALKHARNARHRKAGNVREHLAMSHAMCVGGQKDSLDALGNPTLVLFGSAEIASDELINYHFFFNFHPTSTANNSGLKPSKLKNCHISRIPRTSAFPWYTPFRSY